MKRLLNDLLDIIYPRQEGEPELSLGKAALAVLFILIVFILLGMGV